MTNPGLPAVTPPFTLPELGKLAREMATDIRNKADILADYNLDDAAYDTLCQWAPYAKLLAAFVKEWNSVTSVQDRIKFQSAYALEDQLPALAARLGDSKEPLSGAVETGKLLAKLAGVGEGALGGSKGEKFTINISLGGNKLTFENETRPIQSLSEGKGTLLQMDAISEESAEQPALCSVPEGASTGLPEQPYTEENDSAGKVQREEEAT